MKKIKRFISVLLALLMTLSVFAISASAGGDETVIKEITVSGNVVPKAGQPITTEGIKVSSDVTVKDIFWGRRKSQYSDEVLYEGTFELGQIYTLYVEFEAEDDKLDPSVKAYVRAEEAKLEKVGPNSYQLSYSYPPLKNETVLNKAVVTGVTAPYAEMPIDTSDAKITEGLTILDITWYKEEMPGDFVKIKTETKFQKGVAYGLGVSFKADSFYSLPIGSPFEVAGKTVEVEKPVSGIYNVWVEFPAAEYKKVVVTFNASPGLVSPTTKNLFYGVAYGTLPIPSSSGRTFLGWYKDDVKIISTDLVTDPENHVLTAKWQMNNLVTFDPAGGTVDPTTKSFVCGEAFGALPVPTREGYTFLWWTDENNYLVEETTIVPNRLNMKLTARWQKKGGLYINVLFDAAGGTVDPMITTLELGEPYGTLPTPTREGYVFKGWYDAENNLITKDSIVAGTNNKRLTAKWEKIPSGHTQHTYDAGVVTKVATCTETGEKTYTCTVCGATKVEILPMTDHSYTYEITPATLKKNGKIVKICSECRAIAKTAKIRMPQTFTLSTDAFTYNGKNKKPTVVVTDTAGKTVSNKYYTLTYKNNRNVGRAIVTVTFKDRYSGAKNLVFKINPRPTTLSKIAGGSKMFKVIWKALSTQVTGYQIQYATNKSFTKNASVLTVRDATATAAKVKSLKAQTRYYVRIRTYHTVGGKNYFSAWSNALAVNTK